MNHPIFGPAQAGIQWLTDRVWKVEHAFERANAKSRVSQGISLRILMIMGVLGLGFVTVTVFAGLSAMAGAPDANVAAVLKGARAPLVDRNGALLAADVYEYNLFVEPRDIMKSDRALVRRSLLKLYPDIAPATLDEALTGEKQLLVKTRLSEAQRTQLMEYGLPGLNFDRQPVRDYPLGETAAHYIGTTVSGKGGTAGAERAFDSLIVEQAATDAPLHLALDLRVQGALENELRAMAIDQNAASGVGIVTNVRTGEVIAMVVWPDFDLRKAGQYTLDQRRNVAASSVFEVGSIFKLISVAIGIDSGRARLDTRYDASQPLSAGGGRRIRDFHAENRVISLEEVFLASSNIGTTLMGREVGKDTLLKYYGTLGLLRPANIELKEAGRPYFQKKWTQGQVDSTTFGHGLSISALSYAEAVGAILNGGFLRPLTLRRIEPGQPLKGERVMSGSTSRTMLDLMRSNVLRGSGKRANAPGLRVGGKTGSAEKAINGRIDRNTLVSSFVAVFPTDGPVEGDRYMVLIMFDSPNGSAQTNGSKLGGAVAAPVAGRVISRIAPFLGVERKDDLFTPKDWDSVPIAHEESTGGAL